jgi:hypothetical protein
MSDGAALRERYLRDDVPIRLGGLAANLARIESFSSNPGNGEAVAGMIAESALFIDWTAGDVVPSQQVELAALQRTLVKWHRAWQALWPDASRRGALAAEAGEWSRRVLAMSGLLGRRL